MYGALAALLYLSLSPVAIKSISDSRPIDDGIARQQYGRGGTTQVFPAGGGAFNVSLLGRVTLSQFSASSGNDIWGYVSPSGREYALVGCSNKVAFVEVTDPQNPDYFASVPHSSSTWADIKVYQNFCYIVSEAVGVGIQVVDLSNIDNHQVTLVRTIASPGRSHNISIDTVSGYIYTCGSRNGTGTTMCFDLSNPSNPVQVGVASMTTAYQHDICPKTFTSGPFAGRQILFGNGEGRGVEIWDVTNKNAPFKVSSLSYPGVSYNHQGWLSADAQFWYVDDELDEQNQGFLTRTLVFDVSDIENPVLVNTFTSGETSIDHNLYTHGGFIFESNYTSGLRIFDANDDPTNPVQVGWYDTYPENNGTTFNGTWSNYPYFPSGTIVVNDINRGLFVLDAGDATVRQVTLDTFAIVRGTPVAGNQSSFTTVDGNAYAIKAGIVLSAFEAPINLTFDGTAPWQHASKLRFSVTGWASTTGLTRTIEMYDWQADAYEPVSAIVVGTSSATTDLELDNPDRFIQPGTRNIRARVSLKQTGISLGFPWAYNFDQVAWFINP
jgi:choice-of-anchor B domain-containing protein